MPTVEGDIRIEAAPGSVWDVLTDAESYEEWNPFVTSVDGSIARDEQLRVRIEPPGGRATRLRARVKIVEPNGRLVWIGRFFLPNLFDTRHEFIIEPAIDGVRFLQRGTYAGALVPVLFDRDAVRKGIEASNDALKRRVETDA